MSRWKVGDTQPPLIIDCFDGTNRRPDLTDAVVLKVVVTQRGTLVWERNVTGDANGTVTVALQAGDVDTAGTFFVKVYAEWADGSHQHYPPADDYMHMTVTR